MNNETAKQEVLYVALARYAGLRSRRARLL